MLLKRNQIFSLLFGIIFENYFSMAFDKVEEQLWLYSETKLGANDNEEKQRFERQ